MSNRNHAHDLNYYSVVFSANQREAGSVTDALIPFVVKKLDLGQHKVLQMKRDDLQNYLGVQSLLWYNDDAGTSAKNTIVAAGASDISGDKRGIIMLLDYSNLQQLASYRLVPDSTIYPFEIRVLQADYTNKRILALAHLPDDTTEAYFIVIDASDFNTKYCMCIFFSEKDLNLQPI